MGIAGTSIGLKRGLRISCCRAILVSFFPPLGVNWGGGGGGFVADWGSLMVGVGGWWLWGDGRGVFEIFGGGKMGQVLSERF